MHYKIVVCGDSFTGKTTLLYALKGWEHMEHSSSTSVTFMDWDAIVSIAGEQRCVSTRVWDTMGQERYAMLTDTYYRGACGVVLCFDVTSQDSFNSLERWLERCRQNAPQGVPLVVAATKCDLPREIAAESAAEFAESVNAEYFETSAKLGKNVQECFARLAQLMAQHRYTDEKPVTIDTNTSARARAGGCC